jgi:hypothetical protein
MTTHATEHPLTGSALAPKERLPEPSALGRLATRIAWGSDRRVATKLMGFAATELGSSLDMIRASERTTDARLRRLYYRHGLDEARHAQAFRDAARRLDPTGAEHTRAHEKLHALRQDLHEHLGEIGFVAFVYLAESKARRHFAGLAAHFARPATPPAQRGLAALFDTIGKDENYHCTYSGHLLDEWRALGHRTEVARALRKVRAQAAWRTWRNSGRRIGDVMVRVMLASLFITVVPIFALLQRLARRRPATLPTWHTAPAAPDSSRAGASRAATTTNLDRLRSQF